MEYLGGPEGVQEVFPHSARPHLAPLMGISQTSGPLIYSRGARRGDKFLSGAFQYKS